MRGERSPDNHLDPQVKKLMRVGLGVAGWVGSLTTKAGSPHSKGRVPWVKVTIATARCC